MNLEQLRVEYTNKLTLYERLVREYQALLRNASLDILDVSSNLTLAEGTLVSSLYNKTRNQCKTECQRNTSCKGAIYIPGNTNQTGRCNLKSGNYTLQSHVKNYAIVPKSKLLLYEISAVNTSLITLNTQIQQKIASSSSTTDIASFQAKYNELMNERNYVNSLLDEYQKFESTYHEGVLRSTQSYYMYVLYFILACICIYYVLYPVVVTTSNSENAMHFIRNVDLYAEENMYSIAVLCIGVPICYYLLKTM